MQFRILESLYRKTDKQKSDKSDKRKRKEGDGDEDKTSSDEDKTRKSKKRKGEIRYVRENYETAKGSSQFCCVINMSGFVLTQICSAFPIEMMC